MPHPAPRPRVPRRPASSRPAAPSLRAGSARRAAGLLALAFVGALAGLAAPAARAQINTEALRAKKDKPGLSGLFEGALTWQTGNTDLLLVAMTTRLQYVKGLHSPFLQATYALGKKSGSAFVHNGFLHARWPAWWHRLVATEVFGQLEFNEFRLLRLRALVGAGVRVAILRHKHVEIKLGTGYMFEYEHLDLKPLELHPMAGLADERHPEKTYNHRWTSYLSVRVDVNKWFALTNVVYAQPRFDDFSDVRVLEDFSASFQVTKILAVVLAFELHWDSDPPREVKALDTKTLAKLQVKF